MKKILIINGNPDKESLCASLAEHYMQGALSTGATCKIIHLADLNFDPVLHYGYRKRTDLEPDLLMAINEIQAADHLVFVYPVWWASFPALLKGFFDRTFLPGITYTSDANSFKYGKLLSGKTARLIVTMDAPALYYSLIAGKPGIKAIKNGTLEFCGIKPVRVTTFDMIKMAKKDRLNKMLSKVRKLGSELR